ncbi:Uncharacterised protein [Leminorella richardii]|uniref:Uncharacterized protein n=1 Tax=Leminorella richardii TaxID=158841 RepID=A0A2X4VB40_9GAMM|nr:Uncharacterised protein [Leminorella richardii]
MGVYLKFGESIRLAQLLFMCMITSLGMANTPLMPVVF